MSARKVTMPREPQPWGEAHKREALRAVIRAVDGIVAHAPLALASPIEITLSHYGSETELRRTLGSFGFAAARIDREVARVRALAEGRLVRDRGWRVGDEWYADDEKALARRQAYPGRPLLRVTRIRRAP